MESRGENPVGSEVSVHRTAGVFERDIEGCVALLHPDCGEVVLLNETASDIWRVTDGELSAEEVVQVLARAYDVDSDVIAAEVHDTLATLHKRGFLTSHE